MLNKRWQDWVVLIAGAWFAVSPWIMGYAETSTAAMYNALAVGIAVAAFSAGELAKPQAWEPIVNFIIGLWAVASPWVLGFAGMRDVAMNAVIVGVVVALVSLWDCIANFDLINRLRGGGGRGQAT